MKNVNNKIAAISSLINIAHEFINTTMKQNTDYYC